MGVDVCDQVTCGGLYIYRPYEGTTALLLGIYCILIVCLPVVFSFVLFLFRTAKISFSETNIKELYFSLLATTEIIFLKSCQKRNFFS